MHDPWLYRLKICALTIDEYRSKGQMEGTQLTIHGLVRNDEGVYQCFVENDFGSLQAAALLTVHTAGEAFACYSCDLVRLTSLIRNDTNGDTPPKLFTSSPPSTPTELQVLNIGSRYVILRWDSAQVVVEQLVGYQVYLKGGESFREVLFNTSVSDSKKFKISRLQPETMYIIRVVAYNKNGFSQPSKSLKVVTSAEKETADSIRHLKAYSLSSTSVEVRWDPPLNNEPINYYRLFYARAMPDVDGGSRSAKNDAGDNEDEDEYEEIETQLDSTSYTLPGLEEYVEYQFRVEVLYKNGRAVSSSLVLARTLSDRPSAAPQNVTVVPVNIDTIVLRWAPPPDKECNGPITGYKIRYKQKDPHVRGFTIQIDGSKQEHLIGKLDPSLSYVFKVAAATVNGSGPYSPWVHMASSVTGVEETQVPGAPTSLRVQAKATEILLSWTPPLDEGILIRGFLIGWGINVPDIQVKRVSGSERFYTITNLKPNKDYVISLKAYNKMGNGFPIYETVRTTSAVTTGPTRVIETPIGLRTSVISSTAIFLTWSDGSQYNCFRLFLLPLNFNRCLVLRLRLNNMMSRLNSDNGHYTIRYTSHYGMNGHYRYVNCTEASYTVEGLKPDTQYEFSVKLVVGNADSEWSMTAVNKTHSAAPSSAPRDLTSINSDNDPSRVILSWQPPKHPNGKITQYLIYYSIDPQAPDSSWMMEGVRGDRLSTSVDNLVPATNYYFKIQAVNDRGYGPVSAVKPYRAKYVRKSELTAADRLSPHLSQLTHAADASLSKETIVIVTAVAVTFSLQRRKRGRGYTAGIKKKIPRDVKPPPDLWIHHDHGFEMRIVDQKQTYSGAPSLQDLKQYRTPSPTFTDVPRYHSLAGNIFVALFCSWRMVCTVCLFLVSQIPSGSLKSNQHHRSSASVDLAAQTPRGFSSQIIRTPQVVYTGSKSQHSRSSVDEGQSADDFVPTPPSCVPSPLATVDGRNKGGEGAAATFISGRNSSNPLTSFTMLTPPPPPPPMCTTPDSAIRPSAVLSLGAPTGSKPKVGSSIVIGTKARAMQQQQPPPPSQVSSHIIAGTFADANPYSPGKVSDCEIMVICLALYFATSCFR
ncbi:unnamed protein product [Soboliphyme baturini]|uniref:Neogenin n=1 Tax=Soboliphyme baturini TaxID=241478 RepID=A0A183IPG9_9BILA|nr:unnamed protein product [Soboliphyme baturini]